MHPAGRGLSESSRTRWSPEFRCRGGGRGGPGWPYPSHRPHGSGPIADRCFPTRRRGEHPPPPVARVRHRTTGARGGGREDVPDEPLHIFGHRTRPRREHRARTPKLPPPSVRRSAGRPVGRHSRRLSVRRRSRHIPWTLVRARRRFDGAQQMARRCTPGTGSCCTPGAGRRLRGSRMPTVPERDEQVGPARRAVVSCGSAGSPHLGTHRGAHGRDGGSLTRRGDRRRRRVACCAASIWRPAPRALPRLPLRAEFPKLG